MSSSKLVAYLVEASSYEQRIEIARQILAHNMNFSPAWLLAILRERTPLHSQQNTQQNKFLKVTQFRRLFELIGLHLQDSEVIAVFEYFDKVQKNRVNNEQFIQYLLPTIKESLKKAALKRSTSDIDLTFELKHALRRIFRQILTARLSLKLFQGQFGHQAFQIADDSPVSKQSIREFLQMFGKYPSQSQVILMANSIAQGKLKEVTSSQIRSLIDSSKKQVQLLAQNPSFLQTKAQNQFIKLKAKQLEGSIQIQKILKKGIIKNQYLQAIARQQNLDHALQSQRQRPQPARILEAEHKIKAELSSKSLRGSESVGSPLFKIQRTNSIINNEIPSPLKQLKRATQLADQLLDKRPQNGRQNSGESTPFKRIEHVSNPAIFYPSRRRGTGSDLSELVERNRELEDEIQVHKKDNQNRIREAKLSLGYT